MPAYLVRLVKNRDIVGFFAADDLDDLAVEVDECTDVEACEYVELPPGGIMWTGPAIAVPVAARDDEDELKELPWASAMLTEPWWSVVYGYTEEEWTAFDPDAPREPTPDPPPKPLGPGRVLPMRRRRREPGGL